MTLKTERGSQWNKKWFFEKSIKFDKPLTRVTNRRYKWPVSGVQRGLWWLILHVNVTGSGEPIISGCLGGHLWRGQHLTWWLSTPAGSPEVQEGEGRWLRSLPHPFPRPPPALGHWSSRFFSLWTWGWIIPPALAPLGLQLPNSRVWSQFLHLSVYVLFFCLQNTD